MGIVDSPPRLWVVWVISMGLIQPGKEARRDAVFSGGHVIINVAASVWPRNVWTVSCRGTALLGLTGAEVQACLPNSIVCVWAVVRQKRGSKRCSRTNLGTPLAAEREVGVVWMLC